MKKIWAIILVFVFLFAYKGQRADSSSSRNMNARSLLNTGLKSSPVFSAKSSDIIGSPWKSYVSSRTEPFEPIPPSSIEFLMDYTISSTVDNECLERNLPLRQQIPLFFFSLASQRAEMNVALGASYFTNGEYFPVVNTNKDFRENTEWYSKISKEPKTAGFGDMYADVIERAFLSSSKETMEQKRQIVVMIGDGSYAKDTEAEIKSRIAKLNKELKPDDKSLGFYAVLFCVPPEQREMWERLGDNQFVTVYFIGDDYLNWLPKISKDLMGISDDEQFWLNNENRDDTYFGIPGDSIYRIQGVGLREGGLIKINGGDAIVETSHEIPNWFLDQRRNWSVDAGCENHDVQIHYSGSGPVLHWLNDVDDFKFSTPSMKVYFDGDTNTAVVKSAVQQGAGMPGLENCYEPFLIIDGEDKLPKAFSTSCNFEVCFENSHLVSVFDIGAEISGGIESIEYGFRKKNEDRRYVSSEFPVPFLITQNIKPNYLEKKHRHELKFDGKRVHTFSILIPILFFDGNKWDVQVVAYTLNGQNTSIEGVPPGSKKLCPGTAYHVERDTEKISFNTDEKGVFEILMMTNLGWDTASEENETDYDNYCGFDEFDIQFVNKRNGQSVDWKCQQREGEFICKEERR